MLTIIGVVSAAVAVWPRSEGEIKKVFRPTNRAKRLLGGAVLVALFDLALYLFIAGRLPLPAVTELQFIVIAVIGLILFLTAPVILVGGNLLMTPVEAFFRARFVNQAALALSTRRGTSSRKSTRRLSASPAAMAKPAPKPICRTSSMDAIRPSPPPRAITP